MLMIYLCSPFSAPTEEGIQKNLDLVKWGEKFVLEHGSAPVAPHAMYPAPGVLPETENGRESQKNREIGIKAGLALLERADFVLVLGKSISSGMRLEISWARVHGIPVYQIENPSAPSVTKYVGDALEEADA